MLKYKGYIGVFEFDEKAHLFYGKVLNTRAHITFQGKSVETTKQDFKDVINRYLAWCKKYGSKPETPIPMDS